MTGSLALLIYSLQRHCYSDVTWHHVFSWRGSQVLNHVRFTRRLSGLFTIPILLSFNLWSNSLNLQNLLCTCKVFLFLLPLTPHPSMQISDVISFFTDFNYPSPLGLSLGLLSVVVGQILVILYHYLRVFYCDAVTIQQKPSGNSQETFYTDLKKHLSNPEGFFLLGSYLTITWMFNLLPASYYSFEGGVRPHMVLAQLISIDFFQTLAHLGEHKINADVYKLSHKPHHRFINPKLFDAFDGSLYDTFFMILIPLYLTANLIHCNVWEYMAFGTSYAAWLTLIHSEFTHPWDRVFRMFGLGTAGDHHVHHKLFTSNFGHLFMWWDKLFGTYKSPLDVSGFNKNI